VTFGATQKLQCVSFSNIESALNVHKSHSITSREKIPKNKNTSFNKKGLTNSTWKFVFTIQVNFSSMGFFFG